MFPFLRCLRRPGEEWQGLAFEKPLGLHCRQNQRQLICRAIIDGLLLTNLLISTFVFQKSTKNGPMGFLNVLNAFVLD